ncbi:MAG: ATP-binding protein, partial [Desulfobacterales bacterium]
ACATVRNLLDFTRKDQPVFTTVSVNDALQSTLNLLGNELSLGQVELELELGENLPLVAANPRHLQQLFLNLLLNAVDAMPEGGPLKVRSEVDKDGWVRVDVADSGVGIPEENLDKIFDPFFTTKEPGRGTGLGLSVSFGIAEQHGGRITVQSRPGAGTTFSVFLPRAKDQPSKRSEERERP